MNAAEDDHNLVAANNAMRENNYEKARTLFESLIQGRYLVTCAVQLGWMYQYGLGGGKDIEGAINLYNLAYSYGDIRGQDYLCRALKEQQDDYIVTAYNAIKKRDYEKARKLLESLMQNGNLGVGAINLGWLYQHGKGVGKDIERAIELYKFACSYDDIQGQLCLGFALKDRGDIDQARQCVEYVASKNNISAAFWAYRLNKTKDAKKANNFLLQASQLGHALARRELTIQEMRKASGINAWCRSFLHFCSEYINCMRIVLKDANDPRVR